jgi:hypothetical protein
MSTLTPGDFSAAEQAQIQYLIDRGARDLLALDASITNRGTFTQDLLDTDAANRRVQDTTIAVVLQALHDMITARDLDEPSEAPHKIVFIDPDPPDPSFPVDVDDFESTDPVPTAPPYTTPFSAATMANGGGWELWHMNLFVSELDPDQPDLVELGAAYEEALGEFNDFQTVRLAPHLGSYTLSSRFQAGTSGVQAKRDMINLRNAFYLSIGFTVTP